MPAMFGREPHGHPQVRLRLRLSNAKRTREVKTALAGLVFCALYWAFVVAVPLVFDLGYMQSYLQRRALAAGLGSGVMNLIWIPYLLLSARVKETYGESRGGPTSVVPT